MAPSGVTGGFAIGKTSAAGHRQDVEREYLQSWIVGGAPIGDTTQPMKATLVVDINISESHPNEAETNPLAMHFSEIDLLLKYADMSHDEKENELEADRPMEEGELTPGLSGCVKAGRRDPFE
ncbi:unnamed protein product [Clonostachys byssicola]|uniref:Uncharacterized protein n=1 Tax=Clonostachys byssicola TaxID=160290 RepID=A0A9N9UII8_9HYPO|nr:unnamed protein product [Clonostachys byssicola]